jgi:hypothetical protein
MTRKHPDTPNMGGCRSGYTQHVGNQSRYTEGAAKSILLAESLRSKELKSGSAQTAQAQTMNRLDLILDILNARNYMKQGRTRATGVDRIEFSVMMPQLS